MRAGIDRRVALSTAAVAVFAGVALLWLCSFPPEPFGDVPCSTVVSDSSGGLLGARVAEDGQWRFPPCGTVPEKYARAVILFEDRWFPAHHGINPVSIVRAAVSNFKAGHVVSGGSTITMQVVRLYRNSVSPQTSRSLSDKIIEAVMATRLEAFHSKEEILALYASYAPFGGNVVGIEAASWRYFGHRSAELSWAEAATLAVLPNSPALIHPGRNRQALKNKRDRLLQRLYNQGYMDEATLELSFDEPLPVSPQPLPSSAFHIVQSAAAEHPGQMVMTDIDASLQSAVERIVDRWSGDFSRFGVNDAAAVVVDVRSGRTIAYCGNSRLYDSRPGVQVDVASSPRSTGSILKPFLYGAMLQKGDLLPYSLLPDIPVNYGDFSPQNANGGYRGAVPASEALVRSLNVPAVEMLSRYGVGNFMEFLKKAGMTTLDRPADDYGLTLILGGAEGRLAEICRMYACISAVYQDFDWVGKDWPLTDKCALYYIADALKGLDRPDELDKSLIPSLKRIAWKTGTSYGCRDAWAVGFNASYAVGVWVGNASGESAPDLSGARTAGPVLFDIFNALPSSSWFEEPFDGVWAEVCHESGMLKGRFCGQTDSLYISKAGLRSRICPYHFPVLMSEDGSCRLASPCPGSYLANSFALPPAMDYYYRRIHPEYSGLPPLKSASSVTDDRVTMAFIYPQRGITVKIPPQADGSKGHFVASLAHSNPDSEIFWHLDSEYMGSTRNIHDFLLSPGPGKHILTVVDNTGNSISVAFYTD